MEKYKIEFKWAIIFFIMMLIWMTLERAFGFHDENIEYHAIATNFVALPAIIIYILALRDKREKDYGGYMSYGQGFKTGFIITVILTLLSPILQLIISLVITPDYFTNMIEYSVAEGYLSQADAEANFNLSSYIWQSAIGTLFMGVITTAIVAFFVRGKKKVEG